MSYDQSSIHLPNGWEIVGVIGEGSFGIVYRAKRTIGSNTEWAAVKHISMPPNQGALNAIKAELGTRDEKTIDEYLSASLQDMLGEYFQMKSLLGNTNIVACQDIKQIPKSDGPGYDVYIWMELLESLSNKIIDSKMNRAEIIKMGMDICQALCLLKAKGIVHRDIKPQNIFVNDRGDYKLGDFGSARGIKGTSTMMSMKGTFSYMSPEIMQGRVASFTSDIYSLGLVMYRLMNKNRHPFISEGDVSSARGIEESDTRRLRGDELPMPIDADEQLGRIILKACAYEPRNRWQSPEEMYNALADLSEGTIRRAFPPTPSSNAPEFINQNSSSASIHPTPPVKPNNNGTHKRRTALFICLGVLVLLLILGSVIISPILSNKNGGLTSNQIRADQSIVAPTEKNNGVSTNAPTVNPSNTSKPTTAPTTKTTSASKPTTAPTAKSTSKPTTAPTAVPTLSLEVKTYIGYNSLSWNSISGATSYTIRRHKTNGSYSDLTTTKETTYNDYDVSGSYKYYYTVVANLSGGKTISSNEINRVAATAKPTSAPVKVTEYRYRDSHTAYSDWSSWSSWSTSRESISDSNLKQEESRTQYGWWAAQCTNCGQNNPYHGKDSKCRSCGRTLKNNEGLWKSVFAYTDDTSGTQSIFGRSGGRYINGAPYWRSSGENDRTQYRYRTRTITTEWGSWSSWSTTKPESKTNRQIEERTVTK